MQRVKLLIDMDDCILDFESTWKRLFVEMIGNYDFPERKSFYIYHDLPIEFHEKAKEIANHPELFLIGCAANLVLQGGVKSADGFAVRFGASSVVFAAVRCTAG